MSKITSAPDRWVTFSMMQRNRLSVTFLNELTGLKGLLGRKGDHRITVFVVVLRGEELRRFEHSRNVEMTQSPA